MAQEWLHLWSGMRLSDWLRLLGRNRFAVSPTLLPRVVQMTALACVNSYFAGRQERRHARFLAGREVSAPPLFIIGHWRSGTTFLHELLAQDPRFVWPTTYECLAPSHFLVTQGWARRHLARFLPARRPMDAMRFGFERPQEDEFALLNLGLASPYETLAFPNRRPAGADMLGLDGLTPPQRAAWQAGFVRFLKQVEWRAARRDPSVPRRLLLKSPTHTARLDVLHSLFPGAAFVHLVRNPYELFASTKRLWTVLFAREGLQRPRFGALKGGVPALDDYVFAMLLRLYRDFARQVALIPQRQFCEIRYEDLASRPLDTLAGLYDHLGLGDFSALRGKMADYLAGLDHTPNRHGLTQAERAEIRRRWAAYFEAYGYE
ncbi:MAG TPA: sulfotransferase [Stellaceae bacterium]|nr:sulfotransferase [Stellaceae bacterium]